MDYTKVRLVDFLRSPLCAPVDSTTTVSETPDIKNDVISPSVCAHAPQYTLELVPLHPLLKDRQDEIKFAQYDALSGYALALTSEGVFIWTKTTINPFFFACSPSTQVFFVPQNPRLQLTEPGLVALDMETGSLSYWMCVSQSVIGPTGALNDLCVSDTASVNLKTNERITEIEAVVPYGLVLATNFGTLFLVNLVDKMNAARVKVTKMKSSFYFFQTSTNSLLTIRSGRLLHGSHGEFREVFVLREEGDLQVWHVSTNGSATLSNNLRMGTLIHLQINSLYPNSSSSLLVHDVTVELSDNESLLHALASFQPANDAEDRYLLIVSFRNNECVATYKVQSYVPRNLNALINTRFTVSNGVFTIVSKEALTLVDSLTRITKQRWEESIAFKTGLSVFHTWSFYGSLYSSTYNKQDLGVSIATSMGFLQCLYPTLREKKSTTQARLEQAVFESSLTNPLNFTEWPTFSANPDPGAIDQLAMQITLNETPFLPSDMINVQENLQMRASALKRMYKLTEDQKVRELAQVCEAGFAIYNEYVNNIDIQHTIDGICKKDLEDLLKNDVLGIPKLLNQLAVINDRKAQSALLNVLLKCNENGLGMPHWATCTDGFEIRKMLDSLSYDAVANKDIPLIATVCELLCAFTSADTAKGANNSTTKKMLLSLNALGKGKQAIDIAARYRVYSALAPLEVELWIDTGDFSKLQEHINDFGDVYASAVFETCIKTKRSYELITVLAPLYPQLVEDYLTAHKLHEIAWTLHPRSTQSTAHLNLAMKDALSNNDRKVYASLCKLSAHFNNCSVEFDKAELELKLSRAQEYIDQQLNRDDDSNSIILQHGLNQLQKGPLSAPLLVDILAFSSSLFEGLLVNMQLAFSIIDKTDTLRFNILVQQVVCKTDWIKFIDIEGDIENDLEYSLKDTLFFNLLSTLEPSNVEELLNFKNHLVLPSIEEIRRAYSWDDVGTVAEELMTLCDRSVFICEKFNVSGLVDQMRRFI